MVHWGRADLHMHTTASDGWPTPAQLVDHAARRAALDVIALVATRTSALGLSREIRARCNSKVSIPASRFANSAAATQTQRASPWYL